MNIIPSHQLNKTKWDACVASSSNGLIYANSYYLDAMANEWYGLVINDYETIFPITIRKKWGFSYCYMPAFTQQLGFIGKELNNYDDVLNCIMEFIKYGSPYLNFGNAAFASQNHCPSLSNFIIDLNNDFATIQKQYKKSIDYSLSKASKQQLVYLPEEQIDGIVSLYQQFNKQNLQHVTNDDYANLEKLLWLLQQSNQVVIRRVVSGLTGELQSAALLLKDNKRYYNLINYTTIAGRKAEANYFLYDNILQEFSNTAMLFDFEGSDIPGVKSFYEKFGAINQPYFHWHFNLLPKPLKWFKK